MQEESPHGDEDGAHRITPDPRDPSDRGRLEVIQRLLAFHGFYASEDDVWGDPRTPVVIRVEGSDEELKDYALIREAVASGLHDPHTLVALYASDLRERWRWRRQGRPGAKGELE